MGGYIYQNIHNLECEPIERLLVAMIWQGFSDYDDCCRAIAGGHSVVKKMDNRNPYFEMGRIREFLNDMDGDGHLVDALGRYLSERGTPDMYASRYRIRRKYKQ